MLVSDCEILTLFAEKIEGRFVFSGVEVMKVDGEKEVATGRSTMGTTSVHQREKVLEEEWYNLDNFVYEAEIMKLVVEC